jgi:pimeloyl-ACP methyl ester carboxylesterase
MHHSLPAILMALFVFSSASAEPVFRFEGAPCPTEYPYVEAAECGYVTVPLHHDQPDGETIRVAVAILKAVSDTPLPDPMLYLSGGPGSATLDNFAGGANPYMTQMTTRRDLILMDQRGMGYSEPNLNCPEVEALLYRTEQGPYLDDLALQAENVLTCYERLAAEGIDFTAYTTIETAGDVDAVRQALGLEQVNLVSGSYGTTLAFDVMRDYPQGVRSVFMMATSPHQVDLLATMPRSLQAALDRLFADCAADERCNRAFPQLDTMFYRAVQALEAAPQMLEIAHPFTDETIRYRLAGSDFAAVLYRMLYTPEVIPFIPQMIAAAYAGQIDAVLPIIQQGFAGQFNNQHGGFYTRRCNDDYWSQNTAALESAISAIHPALQPLFRAQAANLDAICAVWGANPRPSAAQALVESAIPTLMFGGVYDPVTPTSWLEETLSGLPNGVAVIFPESSHNIANTPCMQLIFRDFMNDPQSPPDTSCVETLRPLTFVTP